MSQTNLAEQIERLEALSLEGLSDAEEVLGPRRQQPRQIPAINRRLMVWGEWMLSNRGRSGDVAGVSLLGALIDGGGMVVRSTNPGAASMPDDVFDTDRAVQRLPVADQRVVQEQYLNLGSNSEQKAHAVGCSRRTFFIRLAKVHQKVLFLLKPPPSVALRKKSRGCVR